MKKRLLSLLLSVAMVASLIPMSASAANTDTLSVAVESGSYRYGESPAAMNVTVTDEVTGEVVDVDTVQFVVGMDINDVNIDTEYNVVGYASVVQLYVPKEIEIVIKAVEKLTGKALTVGTVIGALQDEYTVQDLVEKYNVSEETALILCGALINFPEELKAIEIEINPAYPTNTGAYMLGAVTADIAYEDTALGLGTMVITPDGNKTEIAWDYEDDNGFIIEGTLADISLGAHIVGEPNEGIIDGLDPETQIVELFVGVNAKGEAVVTRDQADLTVGTYTETAVVVNNGNRMYYSNVLTREIVVVPHGLLSVVFNDVNENNAFKITLDEIANGRTITAYVPGHDDAEITYQVYGTTLTGEAYNGETLPKDAGVYTIVASATCHNSYGMNTAAVAVLGGAATLTANSGEFWYNGQQKQIVGKMSEGLEYVGLVVSDKGEINIVVPATDKTFAIDVQLNIAKLEKVVDAIWAALPEEVKTNLEAEAVKAAIMQALDGVEITSLMLNGNIPTEIGTYDITLIGYGANYQPILAKGLMTIVEEPEDVCTNEHHAADCPSMNFDDLAEIYAKEEGNWYHLAVDYAVVNHIMQGHDTGMFGPQEDVTRAQVVQILYNMSGDTATIEQIEALNFSDVDGNWYEEALAWAVAEGVVDGYPDGTFKGGNPITREEMVALICRYVGGDASEDATLDFEDADTVGGWAKEYMLWAVESGLVEGNVVDGKTVLDAKGLTTRAQTAVMVQRLCEEIL